jgi:uncharacterized protein (DUF952 family)
MSTNTDLIIHICTQSSWQTALQEGSYRHPSLVTEGFIHCSRPEQVLQVANHYYPGARDLLLLWVNPRQLVVELRWDPVGETVFPHLYGPLNLDAVEFVSPFPPDTDGIFRRLNSPFVAGNTHSGESPFQGDQGTA